MSEKIKYTCSQCGKVHDEWPALTFISPTSYSVLSESMKKEIGELSSDFCIVRHAEQTDRFIRATVTIKVNDYFENLEYGVWVSLSEKNYEDYYNQFGTHHHEARYFGWLSNDIPDYEVIANIPTTVIARQNGLRPEVIPHEDFDHQLVRDYYEGISRTEAEKRIHDMLNAIDKRSGIVGA
jgi:hypothetical protein